MRKLRYLWAAFAIASFVFTGCQKDFKTDESIQSDLAKNSNAVKLSPEVKAKLSTLFKSAPSSLKTSFPEGSVALVDHPQYKSAVQRAITPTTCDANTALSQWLDGELADWDSDVIFYVNYFSMLYLPGDLAYVFENSSANQTFGTNGEYTQLLTKTFKDIKRFWNINSSDMVMVGMHGKMMYDTEKLSLLYQLYGNPPDVSDWAADFVAQLLDVIPQYRMGEHPIFTFNAFASGEDFIFERIPPKITMGDGIMDGYTAIGFGDVAPPAILAHEYGHQIQFQLGLFPSVRTPEGTRRTELMADAFSAYYLSHARGASMQWKRVKQFLEIFFNIGDCSFSSTGHHGTPTQRMAAAEWGYKVADNAQKQGQIMTAEEFAAAFDAVLPSLVAQ